MDIHEIKKIVRDDAKARRDAAANSGAAALAAQVFLDNIEVKQTDIVSLYRAIQSELDPAPLAEALRRRGVSVCFPVVMASATPLEFRLESPDGRFERGSYRAEIPPEGSPVVTPTIVVAPLLSFDRKMYRLGYGGGFYDRTLEGLRAASPTRAYGYAYAAQEVDSVPIEDTDQRLDGVATETGLITG